MLCVQGKSARDGIECECEAKRKVTLQGVHSNIRGVPNLPLESNRPRHNPSHQPAGVTQPRRRICGGHVIVKLANHRAN
jgi:hypothetical protein